MFLSSHLKTGAGNNLKFTELLKGLNVTIKVKDAAHDRCSTMAVEIYYSSTRKCLRNMKALEYENTHNFN